MVQKTAKSVILYLLGIKNYSLLEIRKKLTLRKFSPKEIAQAIEECQSLGFLNDEQEASLRISNLKNKGYGPYVIDGKLKQAGLKTKQISHQEQLVIINHLLKKPTFAKKQKRQKMTTLQRRGFDLDVIFEALREEDDA